MPDRTDDLRAVLAGLQPKRQSHGSTPSTARLHIRSAFDAIVDARKRQVSWQQIAEGMTGLGIQAADGEPLDWREVKSLFHAERYARGGTRKRQKGSGPVKPLTSTQSSVGATQPTAKSSSPLVRPSPPPLAEEDDPAPTPFSLKPAILKGTPR